MAARVQREAAARAGMTMMAREGMTARARQAAREDMMARALLVAAARAREVAWETRDKDVSPRHDMYGIPFLCRPRLDMYYS